MTPRPSSSTQMILKWLRESASAALKRGDLRTRGDCLAGALEIERLAQSHSEVYAGMHNEITDLANKLQGSYTGATFHGLRGIGDWEMDARQKSMIEASLRLLAGLVKDPP